MNETPQQIPNQQPIKPQPEQQVPIQPEQPVVMPQQPQTRWLFLVLALVIAFAAYAGIAYWQGVWPFEKEEIVKVSPSPTPRPTPTPMPTTENKELNAAQEIIERFYYHLNQKQFNEAVLIFEPKYQFRLTVPISWEGLGSYAPVGFRDDNAKVLEEFCDSQRTCYLPIEILSYSKEGADLYIFTVQYRNDDGSVYTTSTLGATPMSKFVYGVEKIDGNWKVITTPISSP